MLRVKYAAATVCMVLLAGCTDKKKDGNTDATTVQTIEVRAGNAQGTRTYVGTIQESYGSALSFATPGTVAQVLAKEGEWVRRGQVLAVLDKTSVKSAYTMSKSVLLQAEDAFKRMDMLYKKGSLPEIRYIDAQTKLAEAQAAERIARKTLQDTELRAPFEGFISQRTVDVGNNMMPGISCFKLVKLNRVEMKISVPENEISSIRKGQKVAFTVPALNNRDFTGTVTEKGIQANALSHTYNVVVNVANPDRVLLPGMVCSAQIEETKTSNDIVIPQEAVLTDGTKPFVWIIKSGSAHRRNIVQSGICAEGILVSSGLSIGDKIIVSGQNKVSEGSNVKIK